MNCPAKLHRAAAGKQLLGCSLHQALLVEQVVVQGSGDCSMGKAFRPCLTAPLLQLCYCQVTERAVQSLSPTRG